MKRSVVLIGALTSVMLSFAEQANTLGIVVFYLLIGGVRICDKRGGLGMVCEVRF